MYNSHWLYAHKSQTYEIMLVIIGQYYCFKIMEHSYYISLYHKPCKSKLHNNQDSYGIRFLIQSRVSVTCFNEDGDS